MISIPIWVMLSGVCTFSAIYLFRTTFLRKRRAGEPPIVRGNLLFGSAIDFGKHAVNFLHRCRHEYGRVFTMRLFNQHITMIMDPHSVEALGRERRFDFNPIQEQVNMNVFNFKLLDPKQMVKDTGRTVRGANMQHGMDNYVQKLNNTFEKCADLPKKKIIYNNDNDNNNNDVDTDAVWHESGLQEFATDTIFKALFNSIFGDSEDSPLFNSSRVCQNFEVFHKYFQLFWLGMPKQWVPSAMKALTELTSQPSAEELLAREDSSVYMKLAMQFMRAEGQTDSDIMGHNLVYLHVNYNTFQFAFWTLHHVLENPAAHNDLLREIQEAIEQRLGENDEATFTLRDIESLPILDSIIQETCRLSSGVFIVRYVTEDTPFTDSNGDTHVVRQGDRVAIYPPALHKDPEIFENPSVFQHDRFIDAKFYKDGRQVKTPVLPFGVRCPGQRYATLQLKWFILEVFSRFEMKLKEGAHAQYDFSQHGQEVLPPISDITLHSRERLTFPMLKFSRL